MRLPHVRRAHEAWKAERQRKMWTEPHRLVFIDERGTNTKMTRAHGRCERGGRLRSKAPVGQLEDPDFRARLRPDRAVGHRRADGSDDLRGLCAHPVRPNGARGQHRKAPLEQTIRERGAWLLFLHFSRPTAPDLNPIEIRPEERATYSEVAGYGFK